MTTTETGREAEKAAAQYLKKLGYKILSTNWRNRWCEIDIIATKKKIVYFIEVKYRAKNNWGDGVDAITPKKLQQMTFAAEMWVAENDWQKDYRLTAISVSGNTPKVADYTEID